MLISTRSRYGLKLMYELALRYGEPPVFLRDIAAAHQISEKYLGKLVVPLRGVGLVSSFRGAHGGYALAREPRSITVREIVQVLEGLISPASGPRRQQGPAPDDAHPADAVWTMLDRTVLQAMENVTLEALVQTGRASIPNYQI